MTLSAPRPSVSKQLAANVIGRAWVLLSNIVFFPIYLHLLGIQSFGIIALFIAVVGLIVFLDMGLSPTLARELNDQAYSHQARLNLLFTYETAYAILIGVIVLLVLIVPISSFDLVVSPEDLARAEVADSVRLIFISAAVLMLFNFYIAGILGIEQQVKGNLILLAAGVVRGAVVIIPLWLFPSPQIFLVWQLATSLIFIIVARATLYKLVCVADVSCKPFFERAALSRNMTFMGSIFLVSISAAVNTQIDKVFIGRLLGLETLAGYTLVATFAQILVFVVTPITITLLPRFVRVVSTQDYEGTCKLFLLSHRVVAAIVCAGMGSMVWFGPYLISLWTAGKLSPDDVTSYLPALVLGYGLLALSMLPHSVAVAFKNMRGSIIIAYSIFLTIPSFWIFIEIFGLKGAAATWLVLQAVAFPFYFFWVDRNLLKIGKSLRFVGLTVLLPLALASLTSYCGFQFFGAPADIGRNLFVILVSVTLSLIFCLMITLRPSDRLSLQQSLVR